MKTTELGIDSYLAIHYSGGVNFDLFEKWVTQLRKGVLELCILNAMRAGPVYGYDIVKTLRGIAGLVISDGTIYPILSRLKRDGLVAASLEESPEGPARKYYRLTDKGEQLLARMNAYWDLIQAAVQGLKTENRS